MQPITVKDCLQLNKTIKHEKSSYCFISDSVYIALISNSFINTIDNIQIYPNPTKEKIYFNVTNAEILRISIYGIDGRVYNEVNNEKVLSENELDVSSLLPGFYVIIIETKNGNYNKTFIKI